MSAGEAGRHVVGFLDVFIAVFLEVQNSPGLSPGCVRSWGSRQGNHDKMIVSHLKSKVRSAENELSRNRTEKNNNNRTNQVNSLEMDPEWAAVLVFCSDSCFLLRLLFLTQTIFDFGVAAREPRDIGIGYYRYLFDSAWTFFFFGGGERLFVTQILYFKWKLSPTWSPNGFCLDLLFRKNVKMKKYVWTELARTDCIWAHP